jgi:uroporphyrinogen III methyltransferase/synthase
MKDTVVITASVGAFPGLIGALQKIPVAVEEHPLLSFESPLEWEQLDAAITRLQDYAAVVFTSPRAAKPFIERLITLSKTWPTQEEGSPALWASGPQTAAALGGMLGRVRVPLERHRGKLGAAAALARAMLEDGVTGTVLFPCGEDHRDELPAELRAKGILVDEVICYRAVLAPEAEARVAASRGGILLVASPRVATLLALACPRSLRPALIAVGPTTADSARAAGWPPAAVAPEANARALASAVQSVLANR